MSHPRSESAVQKRRRKIRELREASDPDGLARLFRSLPAGTVLSPGELVLKGQAILVGSDDESFSLEDAEASYREALELDSDYLPALLELAWYYHAVQDDSRKALPYFESAVKRARQVLTEAARGRAACLGELESWDAAAQSLRSVNSAALVLEELGVDDRELLEGKGPEASEGSMEAGPPHAPEPRSQSD